MTPISEGALHEEVADVDFLRHIALLILPIQPYVLLNRRLMVLHLHCILLDGMMRWQTIRHQVRRMRTGHLAERSGAARTSVGLPSQMLHLQYMPQAVINRRAAIRCRRYSVYL